MDNFLELDEKVIIVTGGSSGIGNAIVKVLNKNKAKVVVADIDTEDKIEEGILYVKTDVTNLDSINILIEKVEKKYGRIDVLINNAGINKPNLLVDFYSDKEQFEIDNQSFELMFNINVKGYVFMAQAVVKSMLRHNIEGRIINITSEAGVEGSVGQSIYSATKGATNGLTRSWEKELGDKGIKVVGIAPGINEETGLTTPEYNEALAYTRNIPVESIGIGYEKSIPLRRKGKLEEIGYLAAFLSSNKSEYITGTTINITGGKSRG